VSCFSVLIRPLREEDAQISCSWRNDPEVWIYTGNRPNRFITPEIEVEWIKNVLAEKYSYRFAILADNKYVGNIQITNVVSEEGEYHIFIGEKDYWGKGIATLATWQLLRYAKERLNLKRVYLVVNPQNTPAIRVYEKCGFVRVSDEIKMEFDLSRDLRPTVSVFMMTYNHETYIKKAIESILFQKTNFDFDLVIGEDCSSDNTRSIILDLNVKYSGKLKLVLHDKNVGAVENQRSVLSACTGKYIAWCEGDDYWTDPCKLQKQVEFLEKNDDFVLVGHLSKAIYENVNKPSEVYHNIKKDVLTKRDVIFSYILQAASIMFRRDALEKINASAIRVEHSLYIILAQHGKFKVLPEVMSVYRVHDKGASGTSTPQEAYPGQLDWIGNLKRVMGRNFFWGYHFLTSKVHTYYAIKHPEVFTKGILYKYYYFFKYAFLMLILYPRNIKSVFRMVPDLIRINLK